MRVLGPALLIAFSILTASACCRERPKLKSHMVGQLTCPTGMTLYGESVGGFCCNGTVTSEVCSNPSSICAMDPATSQGFPTCLTCPEGRTLYGESAGGFCCKGAVTNGTCSDPSTICALDSTRAQGYPSCLACPIGRTLYGESVGGFCCKGTVANGTCSDPNTLCALDPARAQGYPICQKCPVGKTLYGESVGGFCCKGTTTGGYCSDPSTICALDPTRTQGNPVCPSVTPTTSPVSVEQATSTTAPLSVVIYGVDPSVGNGQLRWYKHTGSNNGASSWGEYPSGRVVSANDWNWFTRVFAGDAGSIYVIYPDGRLGWYGHLGQREGTADWAQGSGAIIGTGWKMDVNGGTFKDVFAGPKGVIYVLTTSGELLWYRHDGYNGSGKPFASNTPVSLGSGFTNTRKMIAGAEKSIYRLLDNGDLLHYRHNAQLTGTLSGTTVGLTTWANEATGKEISKGWGSLLPLAGPGGVMYGFLPWCCYGQTPPNQPAHLQWYQHQGVADGSSRWFNNGTGPVVATNFNLNNVTAVAFPGSPARTASNPNGCECPAGREYWGGLCYKSCPAGKVHTASCTCGRPGGGIDTNCDAWGMKGGRENVCLDDGEPYGGFCYKPCPSGKKRTAACTCTNPSNLLDVVTDCKKYGMKDDPTLYVKCPKDTEYYWTDCYGACPSGSTRTAACTCDSLQLESSCTAYGDPVLPNTCSSSKGSVCSQLFEDVKASIPMPPTSATLAEQTAGIAGRDIATCSLSMVEGFFCLLPDMIAQFATSFENQSISQSCGHLPPVSKEACSFFVDNLLGVENVLQCIQNANADVQDPTFAIEISDALCKTMGEMALSFAMAKAVKVEATKRIKSEKIKKVFELMNSAPAKGVNATATTYSNTFKTCLEAIP